MLDTLELELPVELENMKLPAPELVQYYKDESNRIFWVEGEINNSIFEMSKMIIRYNMLDNDIPIESRTPIKIFINSPGGLLDDTLALIGLIGISKTPIWTINAGWAYSAAGLILMAGHKRYALPNSQCLIHSGSGCVGGSYEQTESQMKNYKYLIEKVRSYILSKTSIDPKVYKKKQSTEWYLDTIGMVEYGIVDEIVDDLNKLF